MVVVVKGARCIVWLLILTDLDIVPILATMLTCCYCRADWASQQSLSKWPSPAAESGIKIQWQNYFLTNLHSSSNVLIIARFDLFGRIEMTFLKSLIYIYGTRGKLYLRSWRIIGEEMSTGGSNGSSQRYVGGRGGCRRILTRFMRRMLDRGLD